MHYISGHENLCDPLNLGSYNKYIVHVLNSSLVPSTLIAPINCYGCLLEMLKI